MGIKRTLNGHRQECVRKHIQANRLIEILQEEAMGKRELTKGQRASAKFLLTRAISPPVPKDDEGKTQETKIVVTWQQ